MGIAARETREAAASATAVQLPEHQYFKLMSLSKDVALAIQTAEREIQLAHAHVREKEAVRDAYMAQLTAEHATLDFKATKYSADDATCTLTPAPKG